MRLPLLIGGLLLALVLGAAAFSPKRTATGGRRLTGTVRIEKSLGPIAHAEVIVLDAATHAVLARAVTDGDGAYVLDPFPSSEVEVLIATANRAPYFAAKSFVTTGGPPVMTLDAVVPDRNAAKVRLRVVGTQTGEPLRDVTVSAGARPPVMTNAEGDVTVDGLEADVELFLELSRPGAPTSKAQVKTSRARITNVTISLPELTVPVRGTLRDALGKPFPLQRITFSAGNDWAAGVGGAQTFTTTNSRGEWETQLFPGVWRPHLVVDGDLGSPLTIDESSTRAPFSLGLTPRFGSGERCRVVDASGTPVANAEVRVFDSAFTLIESTRTEADGLPRAMSLRALLAVFGTGAGLGGLSTARPGRTRPRVQPRPPAFMRAARGGAHGEVTLPSPPAPCDLVLERPAELIVRLARPTGSLSWVTLPEGLDPNGRRLVYFYESARLPLAPGHHTIDVATTRGTQRFSIVAGSTPTELTID